MKQLLIGCALRTALLVAHRKALRWLMGVHSAAVTASVAAEFGHTTAEALRDRRTLALFGSLQRKPETAICKLVFDTAWARRGMVSASRWVKHVDRLVSHYDLDVSIAADKAAWKRTVKAAVHRVSAEHWRSRCERHTCSTLRLAADGQSLPMVDAALDSLLPAVGRLIIALRTGASGLMLERSRFQQSRSHDCVMCDAGVCEDLPHLLLFCPAYSVARSVLMDSLNLTERRRWERMDDTALMQSLLFLPVGTHVAPDVAAAISDFLLEMWRIRSESVEQWSRLA